METIRLVSAKLTDDAIELGLQAGAGNRMDFRLPMADFFMLRLLLDQQRNQTKKQSSPQGPQPLQTLVPQQLTVLQESLSGDPVLLFGFGEVGDLPVRIPKSGLASFLELLIPFLSPDKTPTTN